MPVEAPRPSLDAGGYGPQPGIVDPGVAKMRDAIIAQNNAEWPVIVRSSNGVQLVEAGSKLAGAAALEGGFVPGARVDPNVQRVAGGLYTGSAPTTSTVWSPGDTSGVDAAAREHILEKQAESALPEKPHDVTYRGQPGQTYRDPITGKLTYTGAAGTEPTPEKPDVHDYRGQPGIVTVDANGNPLFKPAQGTAPTPEKPNIVNVKDNLTSSPRRRTVGRSAPPWTGFPRRSNSSSRATATWPSTPPRTPRRPSSAQSRSPRSSTSARTKPRRRDSRTGRSRLFRPTSRRLQPRRPSKARPTRPTPSIVSWRSGRSSANKQPNRDEKPRCTTTVNPAYGATKKKSSTPRPARRSTIRWQPTIPANTDPPSTTFAPAPLRPCCRRRLPEPKQNAKAPSLEQAQLQQYTPQLVTSTDKLDKITPQQVPNTFIQQVHGVRGNDPSFIQSVLASTNFVNPQQRALPNRWPSTISRCSTCCPAKRSPATSTSAR